MHQTEMGSLFLFLHGNCLQKRRVKIVSYAIIKACRWEKGVAIKKDGCESYTDYLKRDIVELGF